jgi:hypothetical protein
LININPYIDLNIGKTKQQFIKHMFSPQCNKKTRESKLPQLVPESGHVWPKKQIHRAKTNIADYLICE